MKASRLMLCILLSLTLVVTFIPVISFAQDEGIDLQGSEEGVQDEELFEAEDIDIDEPEEPTDIDAEDEQNDPEMNAKMGTEITSVDITLKAPICGMVVKGKETEGTVRQTPQPQVSIPAGAQYELRSSSTENYGLWGHATSDSVETFEGTINGGETYYVAIMLRTKDDTAVFSSTCTANIKGGKVKSVFPAGITSSDMSIICVIIEVKAGWDTNYVKKMKVKKGKKSFTVKWKKQSKKNLKKFNGYQIRYSTKADMSNAKVKNVSNKKKSKTIKKLKKKTKYYVQMRSYTKTNVGTLYSQWSKVKKVKTK